MLPSSLSCCKASISKIVKIALMHLRNKIMYHVSNTLKQNEGIRYQNPFDSTKFSVRRYMLFESKINQNNCNFVVMSTKMTSVQLKSIHHN